MSEFGDRDYWNYRYSTEEGIRYEWLEKFETLKVSPRSYSEPAIPLHGQREGDQDP